MSADGVVPQVAPPPFPTAPVPDGARTAIDAARAKAVAKVATPPAATPAPAAAPGTPAKIEMDPAALKQITKQAAALRAAEARVAELQAAATDSAQVLEAKKLYAEGKRLEAIALLSGKDATEEMAALMDAYLDVSPPKPEDEQAARIAALEADKKARDDAEAQRKKDEEAEKVKQRDAAIQGFAWSVLDAEKEANGALKFPLCSSKKNRGEAATAALRIVSQVLAPKEYPTGEVTPEQARGLFAKAFVFVEAEYEKQYAEELGERFVPKGAPLPTLRPGNAGHAAPAAPRQATTEPTPAEPTRANQSPTLSRPAITTTTYPRSLTPAQAREKAIERIKSFQR